MIKYDACDGKFGNGYLIGHSLATVYELKCIVFESMILNVFCSLLFCRRIPYHKLSGSLSPDLGKIEDLKILYVFSSFFFSLSSC